MQEQNRAMALLEMLDDQISKLKRIIRKEEFTCNNSYMQDDDLKQIGFHTRQISEYTGRLETVSRAIQEKIWNDFKNKVS